MIIKGYRFLETCRAYLATHTRPPLPRPACGKGRHLFLVLVEVGPRFRRPSLTKRLNVQATFNEIGFIKSLNDNHKLCHFCVA